MSKKEKVTEQQEQKVLTKYDRKLQQREEQKKKTQAEKKRSTAICAIIAIALVCFIAYFPIRNYLVLNETYVNVGGRDIGRVEYEYRYNNMLNNYVSQYGSYMSMFGVDFTQDLSTQMYSDTLTWKDFFDEMTVSSLKQNEALQAEIAAAGFTYDTTAEYDTFVASLKDAATEAGYNTNDYIKQVYGSYASLNRISDFIKDDIVMNAFYVQKMEEFTPSADEIQAQYESAPADYDSVDYRMLSFDAEIPTEPTELADTTATIDGAATDAAASETYEASEAEIEKAMEDAKVQADAAEANIATNGELVEGATQAEVASAIREWLFDDARQAGDVTVIEDSMYYRYYVLAFENRYLDETPTADARVIITNEKDGQEILDEWKSGAATEDSFAELCAKYSVDSTAASGGLAEGITNGSNLAEIDTWLFDAARVAGDTIAVASEEDGYTYVMYYVGQNEPEWKLNIENTVISTEMNAYVEGLIANVEVADPEGNLNYLKVQAEEAANAESETAGTEATQAQ